MEEEENKKEEEKGTQLFPLQKIPKDLSQFSSCCGPR